MAQTSVEPKRLYRSCQNRVIWGVAGGIGEYFDTDPVIIRLLFVVATILGGAGILIYIIAAVILPEDPQCPVHAKSATPVAEAGSPAASAPDTHPTHYRHHRGGSVVAGAILIVIGGLILLQNVFSWYDWGRLWPLVLIAVGLLLLVRRWER